MISIAKRIEAISGLGSAIALKLADYEKPENDLRTLINKSVYENPWFNEKNVLISLKNWSLALEPDNVKKWIQPYLSILPHNREKLNIGVVNAGNIPFVGLHDLLSILICGMNYSGKNATGDSYLLKYIAALLIDIEPAFDSLIKFVDKLEKVDAVIATGSNNSARYFEYYFGKYPNVIRKNRNGIAVINGSETTSELSSLGKDIFTYFGLGCRNVSKLYVPENYNFTKFFESIESYKEDVAFHSKYMNNFDYNNSVFLLKKIPFLQNGFLIVRVEKNIASPVSVLHVEYYNHLSELEKILTENINYLQCIVTNNISFDNKSLESIKVSFGQSQSPQLWDYADSVDTLKFICQIKSK